MYTYAYLILSNFNDALILVILVSDPKIAKFNMCW